MSLVTVAESYRAILCMVSANTAFIYLLQSPQNTTHSFVHMNIIRWVCNFQSASQFFFCLKQFCLLFYIHFCYLFDCDKYSIGFILFVSAKNVHMQTRNSIWFLHIGPYGFASEWIRLLCIPENRSIQLVDEQFDHILRLFGLLFFPVGGLL